MKQFARTHLNLNCSTTTKRRCAMIKLGLSKQNKANARNLFALAPSTLLGASKSKGICLANDLLHTSANLNNTRALNPTSSGFTSLLLLVVDCVTG